MAQNVRAVQARMRDLADHHLAEGAERREESLLALLAAKPCASRKVPTLHDSALHVHLRVLLPDLVGPRGTLEVRIDRDDTFLALFRRHLAKLGAHGVSNGTSQALVLSDSF